MRMRLSRALTADGGAALPEIRRAFGDDVFSGASLDRAKLGQLVFADAQKRETLNAILHPMILSEIRRQLDRLDAPGQIVVGDVPLLFECGMESMFDTVWYVRPRGAGNADSAPFRARRAEPRAGRAPH